MFAQPDDEEEFIVIKAGPPLPLRRPRTSQRHLNTNTNVSQSESRGVVTPITSSYLKLENESVSSFSAPQIPVILKAPAVTLASLGSGAIPPPLLILSNKSRNKSLVPVPINKHQNVLPSKSPLQQQPLLPASCKSISNNNNSQRSPSPLTPVESKVRKYIDQVKKFDAEQRKKKPTKFLSLEDLYQVSKEDVSVGKDEAEERLRQTLRIIKEKDEVILSLRESCHDLKLKWADAQNTIDEMRFGLGTETQNKDLIRKQQDSLSNSVPNYKMIRSASAVNLAGCGTTNSGGDGKNASEEIGKVKGHTRKEMRDQSTETEKPVRCANKVRANKFSTMEEVDNTEHLDFMDDDLTSQFGPVLEEKCSNWMEKVQNWKTDSAFNMSQDRDSCGDRDSGFRGSAELEVGRVCRHSCSTCRHSTVSVTTCRHETSTCHHHNSSRGHRHSHSRQGHSRVTTVSSSKRGDESSFIVDKEKDLQTEDRDLQTITQTSGVGLSKSPTPDRTLVAEDPLRCGGYDDESGEGGGGHHSLHIAPPWLNFPGHVHPQSTTDYEGFPSFASSYQSHPLHHPLSSFYAKSMDALPNAVNSDSEVPQFPGRVEIESSSKMLQDLEKRWKSLHPVLDDATSAALRVKYKSQQLSKILQKETEELREARRANNLKRMSLI